MDFEIIDLKDVSEDELMRVISANKKTASLMESEIKKLRMFATTSPKIEEVEELHDKVVQREVVEDDIDDDSENFEEEVDYYYQLLSGYSIEQLEKEITRILPSRHNYNYERILYRMKAEILKKIKEIKDFINSEDLNQSEREIFNEDLAHYKRIIELLDKHLLPVSEEEEEEIENKLIFFPTPSGNIHVFDSLENIDEDYYERFNELFMSIKNGTFKRVKRFSNHIALTGFAEVKEFQVRVVYSRISYDTYAIVSAFVKKSDRDLGYVNYLVKHCRDYRNIEAGLKEKLNDPEFIQLNAEYEEELFRLLSSNKGDKKKPLVKGLRGDK